MKTISITVHILNGATGEVREIVATLNANNEQEAVNKLFSRARRDDYYYRFVGMDTDIAPISDEVTPVVYEAQTYYALEASYLEQLIDTLRE